MRGAQLHKAIIKTFCHLQYVVHSPMHHYVQVVKIILRQLRNPHDGPVRPETWRSLGILKHYCDFNEVYVFVGLHYNDCILMQGM